MKIKNKQTPILFLLFPFFPFLSFFLELSASPGTNLSSNLMFQEVKVNRKKVWRGTDKPRPESQGCIVDPHKQ